MSIKFCLFLPILICSFAIMPRLHPISMDLVFPVFNAKPISLRACNNTSVIHCSDYICSTLTIFSNYSRHIQVYYLRRVCVNMLVGLGGLGVPCSPRDPRFAGSNPTDVNGRKNPAQKSSGRYFKLGVPSLRFQAR